MPFDHSLVGRRILVATVACFVLSNAAEVSAQFFRNGAVGGVAIDAEGVVSQPTRQATEQLRNAMREDLQPLDRELETRTELRRISLRGLNAALAAAVAENREVPDEVRYLAGLQRVQYIFVYPEQNDIVLAGPGEGWAVNEAGEVVGRTSGKPVLQLDDLLVALRTTQQALDVGVSCSIDPTAEGTRRMEALMQKQTSFSPRVVPAIERAMGPQQITLKGVPETSHFARVLVAADYRMKRIAMNLEDSPLPRLPSFLEMLASSRAKVTNMMPRWWLACDYEPLARTDDGLAWELRGRGVKAMTEDDFVAEDGTRETTGRTSKLAARWADALTANYEQLSQTTPVFGQLRNLMDLCVIAAVIDRHDLLQKADCDISALTQSDGGVALGTWNAPKTVATQCSFTKRGRDYLITASGGVQIESWQAAERTQIDPRVQVVHQKAVKTSDRWWQ